MPTKDPIKLKAKQKRRYLVRKYNPRYRWNVYRRDAKRRGKTFGLTYEKFLELWQKSCSYCGGKIDTVGIDRVDNRIGYHDYNCVSCCLECNKLKGTRRVDDFIKRCKSIAKHCK